MSDSFVTLTPCFFTSLSRPGFCPQQPDLLSAGHKLLTICAMLGSDTLSCTLLTFFLLDVTVLFLFFLFRKDPLLTFQTSMVFSFLKDQQVNRNEMHGSCLWFLSLSPQWDLHFFLLRPQASPSFLFCRIWIFLAIHKTGTTSLPSFPALSDWWGSTAAGAATGRAGWGGAFRTMTFLCLEVC